MPTPACPASHRLARGRSSSWWLAGYDPRHARVLALGPDAEVAALWTAAGSPDDTVLAKMLAEAKMLADRAIIDAQVAGRPSS